MLYDIAIIGAGPCGLAVAARLRESTPAALFTDDEHARYWKRFNRSESIESERRSARRGQNKRCSNPTTQYQRSMVVLDASSGGWMAAWRKRFQHLQIEHLRSPLFFHPDPRDRDGLLEFSHFVNRSNELEEIHNVVGKEISKHRTKQQRQKRVSRHLRIDDRDRIDYYTPSSGLFDDYCDEIISRYHMQGLVHCAKVTDVTYGDVDEYPGTELFSLTSDRGMYLAKIIVLAVGAGSQPCIPQDCRLLNPQVGSVCHCLDLNGINHLPEHVKRKTLASSPTNVVVVGGGLTSAQVSDLLIRQGVSKVWLLLRGRYKLKHFDVDLEWVSKLRNQQMAVFWSADTDEERMELLKQARNGGSITPKFDRILQQHVLQGRLEILPYTQIENGSWDPSRQIWTVRLSKDVPGFPKHIDHIKYATGNAQRIENISCLHEFAKEHPVEAIDGLARITNDLMWTDNIPLFLTGGLAGLRLGPGAANLAGARQGAERIAWKIDQLLGSRVPEGEELRRKIMSEIKPEDPNCMSGEGGNEIRESQGKSSLLESRSEYTGGFANQFEALTIHLEQTAYS